MHDPRNSFHGGHYLGGEIYVSALRLDRSRHHDCDLVPTVVIATLQFASYEVRPAAPTSFPTQAPRPKPRSLSEFRMTEIDENAIAAAANIGPSLPAIARGIITTL